MRQPQPSWWMPRQILSSVVASQVAWHGPYGGVVPEIASRKHVEAILPVIEEALSKSGNRLEEVDAIAVTQGPGLVGSLLVGIAVAKSLAFVLRIPWVGVDHIVSHITAAFLSSPSLPTALYCSGCLRRAYKSIPGGKPYAPESTRANQR